jgi:hypothetical protein
MLRPNGSIIGRDSDGMLVGPFMRQAFDGRGDYAAILVPPI